MEHNAHTSPTKPTRNVIKEVDVGWTEVVIEKRYGRVSTGWTGWYLEGFMRKLDGGVWRPEMTASGG